MNGQKISAIAIKDLKEVRQNKAAWLPALIVPLIFAVLMPALFIGMPALLPEQALSSGDIQEMQQMIEWLPEQAAGIFDGLSINQMWVVYSTGFMLAPMFLIMPLMFSAIIGAESFVGERERKTLEALLYSSATDTELFVGKVLAGVVPAVGLSWISYLVYAVVVNAFSYSMMGNIWFPLASWWPLMFWLTPAFSVLGISATVLVSSRVKTFMEAYQVSGSLVLLVLGLVAGQISGVLYLGVWTSILIGAGIWLVNGILLVISIGIFNRQKLIAKIT